jgi:hypothetical protein
MIFNQQLLALMAAQELNKTDAEIQTELKVTTDQLKRLKKQQRKQQRIYEKRQNRCANLPPCCWRLVPKPEVLSHVTAIKRGTCEICGAVLTRKKPDHELQRGECFGEANENWSHGVCSDDCFAKKFEPLTKEPKGRQRLMLDLEPEESERKRKKNETKKQV